MGTHIWTIFKHIFSMSFHALSLLFWYFINQHNSLPLGHLLLPNCSLDQLNCVKIKRCTPDKGWRDSLHDIVKFNCNECCCCFCCPCCEINIENKWATKSCKMTSLPKSWVIKRNKKSAETFFFFSKLKTRKSRRLTDYLHVVCFV